MSTNEVYYNEYLQLNKLLEAQSPESLKYGPEAHDEMLFIIVHQAYELWFKQILHELNSIRQAMSAETINDNSPALHVAVHRLSRIIEILELLIQQVNVIETMTPLDFLDFRDRLRPASGFQSFQFKMIEASLGLKFSERHGKDYYVSKLKEEHRKQIEEIEDQKSVIELVDEWLSRMPYFDPEYWQDYKRMYDSTSGGHVFWNDYAQTYETSLDDVEKDNLQQFNEVLFNSSKDATRRISAKAARSIIFIKLYRDFPILQMPYQLLNSLLVIDELMATWRYRHMNMVHRMIGARIGTGGSSGKDYLKASMDKHYIFTEIADLTSFLIERRNIPQLGNTLEKKLGFDVGQI